MRLKGDYEPQVTGFIACLKRAVAYHLTTYCGICLVRLPRRMHNIRSAIIKEDRRARLKNTINVQLCTGGYKRGRKVFLSRVCRSFL